MVDDKAIRAAALLIEVDPEELRKLKEGRKNFEKLYTMDEAAIMLEVSLSTIKRMIRNGLLPRLKIGDGVRITHNSLLRAIQPMGEADRPSRGRVHHFGRGRK